MNKYAKVGDSSGEISLRLGTFFVSAPQRGLNWALVAIENSSLSRENMSLNNRSKLQLSYLYQLILKLD
jgi:hypothetical protein